MKNEKQKNTTHYLFIQCQYNFFFAIDSNITIES
jgi:hypothetical protein